MTPRTGDLSVARLLPILDSTTRRNMDTHPCLERNSNWPPSQCSRGRRPYFPWTARLLGLATVI